MLFTKIEKSDETYLSLSLKVRQNTFSVFHNTDKYERIKFEGQSEYVDLEKTGKWSGVQWTTNIKKTKLDFADALLSNSKISIFYGSSKR